MKKVTLKKVMCTVCKDEIDPRGMFSHMKLHSKKPQENPWLERRKDGTLTVEQELRNMDVIVSLFKSLSPVSQQFMKGKLAEL